MFAKEEEDPVGLNLTDQRWEDDRRSLLSMDAIADETRAELPAHAWRIEHFQHRCCTS
jgi:hypothetical protein